MKIYTYEPSGALVTFIGYSDAAKEDISLIQWPLKPARFLSPPIFDIYNAKSKLPDIFGPKRLGYFVSQRVCDVFRSFDPEGTEYLPILARGTIGKGKIAQTVEEPYYGVYAKTALDCVDENKSIYIAMEWPIDSGQWHYEDIEILAFKENVLKNVHHFRIKGWCWNSFISEDLAKALKALPRSNLRIRPVDEVFKIMPHNLKLPVDAIRNSHQATFQVTFDLEARRGRVVKFRRRNIDDL